MSGDFQISPLELATLIRAGNPPRLLDVRHPDEHQRVSLPGSVLIPLGQLGDRAGEIEGWRDTEVVVYCHHGIRSLSAISQLRQLGFTRLKNLSGGIDRYTLEADPTLPRY